MAIRSLISPQNKAWLSGNFNNLSSKTTNVESTNQITAVVGSIIKLQGGNGSIGQTFRKDLSNLPAWETKSYTFGSYQDNFIELDVTPFTTTSVTDVVASTFTTASLVAGDYILFYSIEMKNPGGSCILNLFHSAVTQNEFTLFGLIDEYFTCTGFRKLTLTGVNVFTFETKVITPATTNSLRNARYQLLRIA